MRLTICHFDLRFFIVHNFSNNAVSWHSRHNGGSISQMDRLRLSYACLYISRKSETETPSFVSPVLSPRVLILPTEESTRIVVERLEISGGREGKRGFSRGEGKEKQTRWETASRGIMNRDLYWLAGGKVVLPVERFRIALFRAGINLDVPSVYEIWL